MHTDFVLIDGSDEGAAGQCVERLALGDTSGRDEAWLRDTLLAHPDLLPIRELDSGYGPLISLCCELRTEAGAVDAVFVNPHGRLTLVECKLWRNPEARRKVVPQILDYGRAISGWSSPIVNMARNATRDLELHGRKIRRGDTFVLFYPSANRDERVFARPFEFRFDRRPNPHLSFGIGEHFCLGAHLARIEIGSMLRRLTARFEGFEACGAPEPLRASAVGGLKTLPVRYVFRRRA